MAAALGGSGHDVRVLPGQYCVEHRVLGFFYRGLRELDSVVGVGLGPLGPVLGVPISIFSGVA